MVKGWCNCGGVAFELTTPVKHLYVCHCSICRGWTGHGGVVVTLVPKTHFRWVRGEELVRYWKKTDADWASSFCSVCGSALPGENDSETIFIPAGLIREGGEELKISDHIFVASKAHWDEIGDKALQHPGAYGTAD